MTVYYNTHIIKRVVAPRRKCGIAVLLGRTIEVTRTTCMINLVPPHIGLLVVYTKTKVGLKKTCSHFESFNDSQAVFGNVDVV